MTEGEIDRKLLSKYNRQVTDALYLDDFFEGGLDVDKLKNSLIINLPEK